MFAWVREADVDDMSNALGCSFFIVAYFKTFIYVGYGLKPDMCAMYKYFSCCNVGIGDLASMLGAPLLWQTLSTVV